MVPPQDYYTIFFTSGFFLESVSLQAPEYPIRAISNFGGNSPTRVLKCERGNSQKIFPSPNGKREKLYTSNQALAIPGSAKIGLISMKELQYMYLVCSFMYVCVLIVGRRCRLFVMVGC